MTQAKHLYGVVLLEKAQGGGLYFRIEEACDAHEGIALKHAVFHAESGDDPVSVIRLNVDTGEVETVFRGGTIGAAQEDFRRENPHERDLEGLARAEYLEAVAYHERRKGGQ